MAGSLTVGGRIAPVIPQSFEEVQRFANFLLETKLVPKALNEFPKIVAVIMKGLEIGLPPMQAIEVIALINGKMSVYGDGIPALIHASGLCEEFTEYYEGEGDDFKAVCIMRRKGSAKSRRTEFSIADAKEARLWDRREKVKRKNFKTEQWEDVANDAPWFRYWKRMLQMRARGWCARDEFADVLRGIHLAEEVEDQSREEMKDVTPVEANPLVDPGQKALPHSEPVRVDLSDERAIDLVAREDRVEEQAALQQQDEPAKKAITLGEGAQAFRLAPFGDNFEPSRLIQFIDELQRAEDTVTVKASTESLAPYVQSLPENDRIYFRFCTQLRYAALGNPTEADAAMADLAAVKEWVMSGCVA